MKVTGLGLTASLAHFLAIKSIEVIYPGSFYPVEVLVLIVVIFRTYQTERLMHILHLHAQMWWVCNFLAYRSF